MINSKLSAYLGFASKARKLLTGFNTCLVELSKGKIKLIIIAKDVTDNTKEKIIKECKKNNISYIEFSSKEKLSNLTGNFNKGIYGVTDSNFANSIKTEIRNIQISEEAK